MFYTGGGWDKDDWMINDGSKNSVIAWAIWPWAVYDDLWGEIRTLNE